MTNSIAENLLSTPGAAHFVLKSTPMCDGKNPEPLRGAGRRALNNQYSIAYTCAEKAESNIEILMVFIFGTGLGHTHSTSSLPLPKATSMQRRNLHHPMPASRRQQSRDAVHRLVHGGTGRRRHKRITAGAWGRAVRREHPSGEEAEVHFLQLLRLLPLVRRPYRRDFCGVD